MGERSKIEWCDATFNPWHGCTRVSTGCENCYAEAFSKRIGLKIWGVDVDRRFFGEKHWSAPEKWNAKAEAAGRRLRVFCASMADWLEDRRDLDGERHRLFDLIERTPAIDWLLLTKRPEHFDKLAPGSWVTRACPPHVQLGVTAENQQYWNLRVAILKNLPARTRFVSAEPLLGPIDTGDLTGIHQVIVGGESGSGARPMHPDWARSIRDQCHAVAFFFKQWGEFRNGSGTSPANADRIMLTDGRAFSWEDYAAAFSQTPDGLNPTIMAKVGKKAAGRRLDGREWNEFPEVAHD